MDSRTIEILAEPITTVGFSLVERNFKVVPARFPIFLGTVAGLPAEIDLVVACGDLQGRERNETASDGPTRLMGFAVVDELRRLSVQGAIPSLDRAVAVLAGDLYADFFKRGGLGDVSEVWNAFAGAFQIVVGVAGNHDSFDAPLEPNARLLDAQSIDVAGLRIGGVSGVIGASNKPNRKSEADFVAAIERVVSQSPDILVLHEGPGFPDQQLGGNRVIADALREQGFRGLVICGHRHWPSALHRTADFTVLNVDMRAVVPVRQNGSAIR